MSAGTPLRWGILGTGRMSHDWAVAISAMKPPIEHTIVAVAAENDDNNLYEFAAMHDIPNVRISVEDLAGDPEIDVIYIGITQPADHLRVAKLILDHGKHILCEKPLCMNARETTELVEYAREKKLFLMEAICSRFFHAYTRLREEIENGFIGDAVQVRVDMGLKDDVAGRPVIDKDTYISYTCQFITLCFKGLRQEKIVASGHLNASGEVESCSAVINYPDGKTATLITHSKTDLPCEAVVSGTKAGIKLFSPFWAPHKLEMLEPHSEPLHFPIPETDKETNFENSTGMSYQCTEVKRCILQGLTESPLMSHEESILLAEMREEIRKQIGVV